MTPIIPPYRDTGQRGRQTRALDRATGPLAFRAENDAPGFEGRVSSWWVVDSFGTCRAPGAFTKTVQEKKGRVPVLRNHYHDARIGQTLSLAETEDGLDVDARLTDDDNGPGHWTIASLRAGDDWGMSFGFDVYQARAATDQDPLILTHAPAWIKNDPTMVWVHTEVGLWEVSPVTWGSDPTAGVTDVRSTQINELLQTLLDEIRAGRLSPERRALLDQLVAAATETAGPDRGTPAPERGAGQSPETGGAPQEPPTGKPNVRDLLSVLELELELIA